MKKFLDSRYAQALWFTLMSLLTPLFLALFFFWIPGIGFWMAAQYMFYLFSAFALVSAALLLLTPIHEDLAYGFGMGIYYGTLGLAYLTTKLPWYMPNFDRIALCGLASCLIAYIVWLSKYR